MDANYSHYILHKFRKWPSEFLALPREERAFVMASIDVQVKKEQVLANKK